MKAIYASLFACSAAVVAAAETSAPTGEVFREPFTLRLGVDREHFYEQKIDRRIPYVHNGSVLIFCGEHFGVRLKKEKLQITQISYEPNEKVADLVLAFRQETVGDGLSMVLELENHTTDRLFIEAAMVVLDRKTAVSTSIIPLGPGLTSYEMWPHPIVQLMLYDIQLTKEKPTQARDPTSPSVKKRADARSDSAGAVVHS